MLQGGWQRLPVLIAFAALVVSSEAARPIRHLQQSSTSLDNSILGEDGLSPRWTDWSWSMKRVSGTEDPTSLYCFELDPFGALSLKSEHVFTAENKILHVSLRKLDTGSPSLHDLRIQLEGCTMGLDGYSVTASKTLEEAVSSSFPSEVSKELLQEIDSGNEVSLAIPLTQFTSEDSKQCTYNRITIGRCIKALMENAPCEIEDDEIGTRISLCIDSMALTQSI